MQIHIGPNTQQKCQVGLLLSQLGPWSWWTPKKTVYAEIDVRSSRRCIAGTRTTKTMNSVGQLGEDDDEKADSFKIETTMVRRITNLSLRRSRFSQV
ncbi:hypothetical protein F2Q69_00037371 [Brassica cretica]|uniref:Uncharacterized protein n=1 Tax=Brassica cretica TaxID=69181 RepID=A0A8S9SEN9_BRACR|nr:hypothetical protein F2Q69_00037371 [Brassica cretica]